MPEQFYTILTSLGQAELANAIAHGTQVALSQMAVGDGNGNYYEPSQAQTGLIHETYRAGINSKTVDPVNGNWIICELDIPATTGGWYIREVGIFSTTGNLFAIGKVPVTYKPQFSDGAGKDLVIKVILEVSNASAVTLQVDPSVVLASKKYVDDSLGTHINSSDPHPAYALDTDVTAHNTSPTAHQDIRDQKSDKTHRHDGTGGALDYAVDTGAANAYVINLTPDLLAHVPGMTIRFKAANTNTGASTIAIDALAAVAIKKLGDKDLNNGDIKAGWIYEVVWDGVNYQLVGFRPAFRGALVMRSADKVIASGVTTLIDWDIEVYDTDNLHDNVINNSRLTVPAGVTKVRVSAQQYWYGQSGSSIRQMDILKNGRVLSPRIVSNIEASLYNNSAIVFMASPVINVVPGDYFETFVVQTTGLNLSFLATLTFFSIEIIE